MDSTETANSNLVQLIQQIAMNAVKNSNPSDYTTGTVVKVSPLQIKLSQSLVIDKDFLVVPERLTDHKVKFSFSGRTQTKSGGSGYAEFALHDHDILVSDKEVTIHNGLKVGDKVLLMQKAGGQEYYIIDKVVST